MKRYIMPTDPERQHHNNLIETVSNLAAARIIEKYGENFRYATEEEIRDAAWRPCALLSINDGSGEKNPDALPWAWLLKCPTCKGEGWLMDSEGEPCPDCQHPEFLGGTGYVQKRPE